ncbi:MAG: LD-carboxypeptidase [Planctomycetota bacterium]
MSDPRLPPPLRPGDGVSLVAPASSPSAKEFQRAVETLADAGYRPKTYRDVCDAHGYLAGTDDERVADLEAAFADPETRLVLAVRGGYGVARILDRVDFGLLSANPKLVCGYSDLTALHAAVVSRCGLPAIHGPNLMAGIGDTSDAATHERRQWTRLASGELSTGGALLPAELASTTRTVTPGAATGPLVGGNLAVLVSLLATRDQPSFDGAILLLEDTGEAPYRIDRLLTQMRVSGLLGRLAGVVLGYFTDADPPSEVDRLIDEFFAPLGVPVLARFPSGHEHPNLPLPIGARVELDATERRITLRQAIVAVATA